MRTCVICGDEYDHRSPDKRRAGGLITHCVNCSEETSVRYAGISSGEGKMAQVQILKFQSTEDRQKYMDFWWVNSGMMVGKSCQLGLRKSTPAVSFETRATFAGNTNNKGKA